MTSNQTTKDTPKRSSKIRKESKSARLKETNKTTLLKRGTQKNKANPPSLPPSLCSFLPGHSLVSSDCATEFSCDVTSLVHVIAQVNMHMTFLRRETIYIILLMPFCGHDRKHKVPNQMHKTDPMLCRPFSTLLWLGFPPSGEASKAIRPLSTKRAA